MRRLGLPARTDSRTTAAPCASSGALLLILAVLYLDSLAPPQRLPAPNLHRGPKAGDAAPRPPHGLAFCRTWAFDDGDRGVLQILHWQLQRRRLTDLPGASSKELKHSRGTILTVSRAPRVVQAGCREPIGFTSS